MKRGIPAFTAAVHQGSRFHRIVKIVAQGITDGIRHDDRPGKMDDGIEFMFGHQAVEKLRIANIAFDQFCLGRHGPPEAGRKIVDHHDLFARINESQNHVAADVARAACHQNCHDQKSLYLSDPMLD